MEKFITLKILALTLASCGSHLKSTPCSYEDCKTVKRYSNPPYLEVKPSNDPLEILISKDLFNLYDNKVEIPYRFKSEDEAK